MDNRATTINCYALGNVIGNASNTNKVHIGGFVGQSGGIHYNCYAAGDVISKKPTTDVGGINGRLAGIAIEINGYFNSDAKQEIAGVSALENAANGVDVTGNESCSQTYAKSAEELSGKEFAEVLNSNKSNISEALNEIQELLKSVEERGYVHALYYNGDGTDLNDWDLLNGVVGFKVKTSSKKTSSSHRSSNTSPTASSNTEENTNPEDNSNQDNKPRSAIGKFKDVKETDWYYNDVKAMIEAGLMNGVSDEEFAPEIDVTRGMFVTILYRFASEPEVKGKNLFKDINNSEYYADAVAWANENGIVYGYSENEFAPNDAISREQMVTILYRYAVKIGKNLLPHGNIVVFEDAENVSEFALDSVSWAYEAGILNGYEDNTLKPQNSTTRAQTAAIIQRFISLITE